MYRFLSPLTVSGVIPIETRVSVCPFVTSISPSSLARSLQTFHTIKNRNSIPWLVLGVTICQIFSHFSAKNVQNLHFFGSRYFSFNFGPITTKICTFPSGKTNKTPKVAHGRTGCPQEKMTVLLIVCTVKTTLMLQQVEKQH